MKYYSNKLIYLIIILIVNGCSYNFQSNNKPKSLNYIFIKSNNYNSPFVRTLYYQLLYIYHIKVLKNFNSTNTNIPILILGDELKRQYNNSVFMNGQKLNYKITINVNADILLSKEKKYYTCNKVTRFFFNNDHVGLIKDFEYKIILQEMRYNLSEQIIHKLFYVYIQNNKKL